MIVAGDFNTFQWTNELLEDVPGPEPVLTNLVSTDFVDTDLYTFNFEGNSQALDSMFVTDGWLGDMKFDVVHLNVDFPRRFADTVGSDHEPLVASFKLK